MKSVAKIWFDMVNGVAVNKNKNSDFLAAFLNWSKSVCTCYIPVGFVCMPLWFSSKVFQEAAKKSLFLLLFCGHHWSWASNRISVTLLVLTVIFAVVQAIACIAHHEVIAVLECSHAVRTCVNTQVWKCVCTWVWTSPHQRDMFTPTQTHHDFRPQGNHSYCLVWNAPLPSCCRHAAKIRLAGGETSTILALSSSNHLRIFSISSPWSLALRSSLVSCADKPKESECSQREIWPTEQHYVLHKMHVLLEVGGKELACACNLSFDMGGWLDAKRWPQPLLTIFRFQNRQC